MDEKRGWLAHLRRAVVSLVPDGGRRQAGRGRALRLTVGLAAGYLATVVAAPRAHAQYVGQISSIVMDARTGAVLSQSNPDLQRFPASLTKLMTLYMAFKAMRAGQVTLDQAVPVSAHSASMEPSKLGLVPGSYLTVEQAVLGLVTKSANDAACALGELLGGGDEARFADLMTRQARALGMVNTTFRNASGLPNDEQMTSARDLALLTRQIITEFPEYYHYFSVPAFYFHGRQVPNHDPMLRIYPGADGLKTGYTVLAGRNLVTSAVRENVRLIGVVLGARSNPQRSALMAGILDDGFRQEGVADVRRPLVLARGNRRRAAIMLAAATRGSAGPDQVAELPSTPRHRIVRHGHAHAPVHMVAAGHAGSHAASHRHGHSHG
ncbi:D-alanyl-D-alanine carboxypeptidase family protein [Gluconacetobacter takamatsuzukensis]|uniref:D-alanyl-D-alanine carboxypeptidase n=1 Tax=Gluconacetobacter takamatsuzukensis TaxID=1286190 RepID=A0A7W4PP74_9PROT|nr:D-alanyl-D-alanine carboxypeptidase family protein [Gluconacetobacter takamatsuzukensis]MBB2205135.1 D-alanyl-D-alanine carboxypeptidase [Gluconacetobacter takamatsuzukensis]